MSNFASKVTGKADFTTGDDTFTLEGGEPVRVHGFVLSNTNATATNTALFEIRNGTTLIQSSRVPGNGTVVSDISFIADAGLTIEVTGNETSASVTVFHTHPGN